jgi:hypothetical protein
MFEILYYCYNFYSCDFHPNILTMFVGGDGVFVRGENKLVRLV